MPHHVGGMDINVLVTVLQVHVQVWVILVYVGHHPPTPPSTLLLPFLVPVDVIATANLVLVGSPLVSVKAMTFVVRPIVLLPPQLPLLLALNPPHVNMMTGLIVVLVTVIRVTSVGLAVTAVAVSCPPPLLFPPTVVVVPSINPVPVTTNVARKTVFTVVANPSFLVPNVTPSSRSVSFNVKLVPLIKPIVIKLFAVGPHRIVKTFLSPLVPLPNTSPLLIGNALINALVSLPLPLPLPFNPPVNRCGVTT